MSGVGKDDKRMTRIGLEMVEVAARRRPHRVCAEARATRIMDLLV
jgi:hypothetical protein